MASMLDIQHVLLLMMENRSFDHYLGALALPPEGREDVDGLPAAGFSNPSKEQGGPCTSWQMDAGAEPIEINDKPYRDPPHEYAEVLTQINGGAMDGFITAYERFHKKRKSDPKARAAHVMGYYTRRALPVLYALADQFTVCNRWFSSFAGSTWPNRVYTFAGDADELVGTGFKWLPRWNAYRYPDPPFVSAWGPEMAKSWKAYSARPEQDSTLALWRIGPVYRSRRGGSLEAFAKDCQNGTLPRFGIIEPDYAISDDHPPHNPLRGQQVMARVVKALLSSASWPRTLLIITYDEHGGFFDHVPPPPAPEGRPAPHDRLGVRVPTVVISGYTPAGHASRELFDHTSILKTVAERWGFGAPGMRASSPAITSLWHSSCLDFTQPCRSGPEILRYIPEPGFNEDSPDIAPMISGKPTALENDLRRLNLMRELERLR
jgi:phospholipase C